MAGVRTGIDVGRLAAAAKRPGIDPRVWLTLAVVQDVGFDPDEGIFVDLQYQPSGELETALLGAPHAGNGFGAYFPVKVDDTVLVAVPMGDPGHGPIIICRMWNAGDPPAADFGDGEEAVSDTILRVEDGTAYRVFAKNGDVSLQAEDGKVELSKVGASQSFVRGDDQKDALDAFLDALKAWAALVKSGIEAGGGTIENNLFNQALATAKNDLAAALSTKIKGE